MMMGFREKFLSTGTKILVGRNSEDNDRLVKEYKGKSNTLLHTSEAGSPFCVIEKERPTKKEVEEAGAFCARYSQDWRDNKRDTVVHVFTGHDVKKRFWMKSGTWHVRNAKEIKIKKSEIQKVERQTK